MFPFPHSKNLNNCCRTCLNSTANMYDIFSCRLDSYVYEILSFCTNIKVELHDALPKQLCSSCFNCLVSFYDFRRQAERIDQDLQGHVQGTGLQEDILYTIEIKPENDDDCRNDFENDYNEITDLKKENQLMYAENDCLKFTGSITNEQFYLQSDSSRHSEQVNDTKYYCEVCKKTFRKLDKFHAHLSKHKKNIYECNFCLSTFSHKHKYIKHLDEHKPKETKNILEINQNESQRVNCNTSENYKSVNTLSTHRQVHMDEDSRDEEKVLTCLQCSKVFKRVSDLVQHESIQHFNQNGTKRSEIFSELVGNIENQNVECNICFAKFKSINSLSAHKRVHLEKGRILSCSSCGKVFKKISHLKRHELTHDVNRPFKCNICPKSFITDAMLKEHLNIHCGVKLHSCPLCSKTFACLSTMKKHMKTHTREKVYMCSICGKRFDCSSNMNQHTKRHIGLKTFSCTLCPRSFVSKGELKSHNITHTGERAYSCEQCGATFTKRNSLSKHTLIHLGIRPHQCETCSMRFASKDHLKRHIRIHTGEKPYRCDMCDRAFTQSNDLVKHQRAHLGDKLYRCSECSEGFRLKTELRQHISEHFISSRLQALSVNKIVNNTAEPSDNQANNKEIKNDAQTEDKDICIEADMMENLNNTAENTGNVMENSNNTKENSNTLMENSNNVIQNILENTVQNPVIISKKNVEQV